MKTNRTAPHFKTLELVDVPRSRNGKHKVIVTAILRDLDQLGVAAAFRVPLEDLGDSKENVRSALNRATRKSDRHVATATDEKFLYVWNVAPTDLPNESHREAPVKLSRNSRNF